MPSAKSKKMVRKPRRQRRRRAVVRKYTRGGHIKEVASAQFTTSPQLLQPSQSMSNGVYGFRNFSLVNASNRIQNIAQGYQEYRIKKITWQCKGFFDTFVAPTSATAPTVPHLYWRVDKLSAFNADTTLNTLKASGCKPIRLDDKLITKSFKPTVLIGTAYNSSASSTAPSLAYGAYKTSPWLPTNDNAYVAGATQWVPSTIDHLGLLLAVDCDVVPFASVASVQFTVEFEFRKPLDDIDPNGVAVMQIIDLADLQPKKNPPEESKMQG